MEAKRMGRPISFSLVVPVYDESCDVFSNINAMNSKLNQLLLAGTIKDCELIILANFEGLPKISDLKIEGHVKLVHYRGPNELGGMFKKGIELAIKEYVGLITPYNQVDLDSLDNILKALQDRDMAVAYVGNLGTRPWYREAVSALNTALVNLLFGLKLKYYHLNFYRTDLAKKVKITTESHAAMVEAAVWLAKSGANLAQVPFIMIPHNFKSKSKAFRIKNIIDIFKTYFRLFWQVRILRKRINLI